MGDLSWWELIPKTNYVTTVIFSSFCEPISFWVNDAEETNQKIDLNFQDRGMCVLAVCWQRLARFVDFVGSQQTHIKHIKMVWPKNLTPRNNPGWKLPRKTSWWREVSPLVRDLIFPTRYWHYPKVDLCIIPTSTSKGLWMLGCFVSLVFCEAVRYEFRIKWREVTSELGINCRDMTII